MNDYRRTHVPAFGSWDCYHDLPFTQCFESARQLRRYGFSEDRDLYVAGDLYENDVVTSAMIVVPRTRTRTKKHHAHVKERKEEPQKLPYYPSDTEELDRPKTRPTPKPVDEDLYKISPALLCPAKPKKKGVLGFFSSCLLPTCVL